MEFDVQVKQDSSMPETDLKILNYLSGNVKDMSPI
jgi:hypothetical protein